MKKALFVFPKPFNNNSVFNEKSKYNVDGLLQATIEIRKMFFEYGIQLDSGDYDPNPEYLFYIFADMPRVNKRSIDTSRSYMILMETDLIRPDNWVLSNHDYFKKIFTWNEDWIDQKKYIKYHISRTGRVDFLPFSERKKLCTLISGNKRVSHPLELYSLRCEYIDYFEKNHSEDFDFYGVGWDKFYFRGPKLIRALNRLTWLQKFLAPKFKNYRGMVDRKIDVLKYYKFSLCFENGRDLPNGHVSEKIIDSLAAGCIPIYYGADNVTDFVPKNCFIDYHQYKSKEDLYLFIKNMDEKTFNQYLENIKAYWTSDLAKYFSPEHNAGVLVQEIVKDLKLSKTNSLDQQP